VIEDKPKPAKKAKEVAPVIEAEVVETTQEPAEDKSWTAPLEASLGANEVAVNAFLATKGQIEPGQTWRDLADATYRQRIIANPEGFVNAATATKE
jgi:mannose/cellobiose epimerase-like protein (N-acyl-D-glucosamine 2-epimerase family)